jgi:hypothetical protein
MVYIGTDITPTFAQHMHLKVTCSNGVRKEPHLDLPEKR